MGNQLGKKLLQEEWMQSVVRQMKGYGQETSTINIGGFSVRLDLNPDAKEYTDHHITYIGRAR